MNCLWKYSTTAVCENKLVVSQNTFSYVIKIVSPFPFPSLITAVAVCRERYTVGAGWSFFILTKFHTRTRQRENCSSVYLILYILGQQTGRQKVLHRAIAGVPWLQSALISFLIEFWFVRFVPKYPKCSTFSKELLSNLMWFWPCIVVNM